VCRYSPAFRRRLKCKAEIAAGAARRGKSLVYLRADGRPARRTVTSTPATIFPTAQQPSPPHGRHQEPPDDGSSWADGPVTPEFHYSP